MTPEQYLMQVKDLNLRIRSLEGELADAKKEKDSEYAAELEIIIKDDIEKYKSARYKIREEIQQIGNTRFSVLLTEYYIRGKSWEQVAKALGLSDAKWVRKTLRERALKSFASAFPKYFL